MFGAALGFLVIVAMDLDAILDMTVIANDVGVISLGRLSDHFRG